LAFGFGWIHFCPLIATGEEGKVWLREKYEPRRWSWQAMVMSMRHSLVEDIAASAFFQQLVSTMGKPRLYEGDAVRVALPREGIISGAAAG
jgi:hypothetical protein